jgi:hypothetical protein
MNEQELQRLVEHISSTVFRKPFRHRASFNRRLKTTGGRYHLGSHDLDFNPIGAGTARGRGTGEGCETRTLPLPLASGRPGLPASGCRFPELAEGERGEPVRKGPAPGWNSCAAEMAVQLQCLRTDVSAEKKD